MSSRGSAVPTPERCGAARSRGPQVVLLALALVGGLGTLAVMAWAGGWVEQGVPAGTDGATLAFVVWDLAPFAGALALVVATRRRQAGGTWALLLGLLALVGMTAWLLHGMVTSESSTAALLLLVLPVYQWLLLALTAAASAVVHRTRLRRRRAAPGAGQPGRS